MQSARVGGLAIRVARRVGVLLALAQSLAAQGGRAGQTAGGTLAAPFDPSGYLANDSHFHLTNYVQQGPTLTEFLKLMGTKIGRVALFGIPLQQQWSYRVDGNNAPTYYLATDAPLYYYSFTDAAIAMAYRALPPSEQARFEPMITGFNPADMYAADHIRRVLQTFPGVFTGIGEFTIHKEFVSGKIAGGGGSLTDPALDKLLDFAAEVGLVVILHSDIDLPFAKPGSATAELNLPNAPAGPVPQYLAEMAALFKRHANTTIIWAHTGLGRTVRPMHEHVKSIAALAADPSLPNLYFDISWKVVADYVTATDSSLTATVNLLDRFPDRFLFGTDALAPTDEKSYLEVYTEYEPLFKRLAPATSEKVRKENFARIFDMGRQRVRAWERAHPQ